mgnify:CR=1 FL=1
MATNRSPPRELTLASGDIPTAAKRIEEGLPEWFALNQESLEPFSVSERKAL